MCTFLSSFGPRHFSFAGVARWAQRTAFFLLDIRLPHTLPNPQFLALIIANAAIGAPKPRASISMCAGENAAAKTIDVEIVAEGEGWAHPPASVTTRRGT